MSNRQEEHEKLRARYDRAMSARRPRRKEASQLYARMASLVMRDLKASNRKQGAKS